MNIIIRKWGLVLFCVCSLGSNLKSQNNVSKASVQSKILYYNFDRVQTQEQLQNMKTQAEAFKYVTKVDIHSNIEEGTAEMVVYVTEVIQYEGDPYFNQIGLSELVKSSGLHPTKFSIDVVNPSKN